MGWPVCLVEIHGRDTSYQLSIGQSPGSDLKQCTTRKKIGIGSPAGIFTLRLTNVVDADGKTWANKIQPQDFVVIQMARVTGQQGPGGSGSMHTVMIGLVDSIQSRESLSLQGIPANEILVHGRDIGKIFIQGMVTFFSFAGASLLGKQEFVLKDHMNGFPSKVILALIDDLFNNFMKIQWVKNGFFFKFWDVLHYSLGTYTKNFFPGGYDHQFLLGEGSFWSLLTKIASPPFHELWIDTRRIVTLTRTTRDFNTEKDVESGVGSGPLINLVNFPGKTVTIKDEILIKDRSLHLFGQDHSAPVLMMRPTPFPLLSKNGSGEFFVDTTQWKGLLTHTLTTSDLLNNESVQESLGVSDAESYNTYMVFPRSPAITEQQFLMSVPPLIDLPNLHRYGYRPLMPHVSLFKHPASTSSDDPVVQFYKTLTMQMAGWYLLNDRYVSGQKTLQLMPHIHVGDRLHDQSSSHRTHMMFYIESVEHTFIQNQQARTTLGVTRGLSTLDDERYEPVLKNAAQSLSDPGVNIRKFFNDHMIQGLATPQ